MYTCISSALFTFHLSCLLLWFSLRVQVQVRTSHMLEKRWAFFGWLCWFFRLLIYQFWYLVYTTQLNSTFRARWLASAEVISQGLFASEQPRKNKMAFVGIFSQIKSLFGQLVIQLVWYILKQLFTSVSVKVVDIYLATLQLGKYPPLFTSTLVNNC